PGLDAEERGDLVRDFEEDRGSALVGDRQDDVRLLVLLISFAQRSPLDGEDGAAVQEEGDERREEEETREGDERPASRGEADRGGHGGDGECSGGLPGPHGSLHTLGTATFARISPITCSPVTPLSRD